MTAAEAGKAGAVPEIVAAIVRKLEAERAAYRRMHAENARRMREDRTLRAAEEYAAWKAARKVENAFRRAAERSAGNGGSNGNEVNGKSGGAL